MNDLLTIDDVMDRTTLGRSTIYAMMKAGTFPKQLHLSERKSRWTNDDINAWIQSKIDERDHSM